MAPQLDEITTGRAPGSAEAGNVPAHVYRTAIRAFSEAAGLLNRAEDTDVLLHHVSRSLCQLIDVGRCSIYLRHGRSSVFKGQVHYDGTANNEAAEQRVKRLVAGTAADGFTEEIVRTKRPVVVSDGDQDRRLVRATMRDWNIRSILGVPMILGDEVIGIVFCDDNGNARAFDATERELASAFCDLAAVAISQAATTAELRSSVRTVARRNDLLRRASEVDDRLAELVLEGGNLQEIARAVADLTGKPCEIYDKGDRRLAGAVPDRLKGKVSKRLLDGTARALEPIATALTALGPKGSGVVPASPRDGQHHRCLIAPIAHRDQRWGSVVLSEQGARFGQLDLHILRRAATNAAVELAAERRAARAEVDARASLAADLVRGSSDPTAITRRAEFLGMDVAAPHVLVLVGTGPGSAGDLPPAALITEAFAKAGIREPILATGTAEGVLVVVPIDQDATRREAVRSIRGRVEAALGTIRTDIPLAAGLSTACTAIAGYGRAYTEARQVLSCLHTLARAQESVVLSADDLGAGRLFLASSSREDADRFAQDALGVLLDRTQDNMVDLLQTLRIFFENARSIRRSASALGVHENTIRYRLARVEEHTGLAVNSSSDDQLTIQLALLILRLQGWDLFPSPAVGTPSDAMTGDATGLQPDPRPQVA